MLTQRMILEKKSQILHLVLSLLGAGVAIYLITVHYENAPLVCSANGIIDCARVLSSTYSLVPGTTIPISLAGLVWCLVMTTLAIANLRSWISQRSAHIAEFAWSTLGILTVLYLVYVEIVRLHSICFWCTVLHVLILIMFLVSLVQIQAPVTPDS
jgi:uncharacterized membrane protein